MGRGTKSAKYKLPCLRREMGRWPSRMQTLAATKRTRLYRDAPPPVGCCLEGDSRQGCKPCRLLRVMPGPPESYETPPRGRAPRVTLPLAIRRVGRVTWETHSTGESRTPGTDRRAHGTPGMFLFPRWFGRGVLRGGASGPPGRVRCGRDGSGGRRIMTRRRGPRTPPPYMGNSRPRWLDTGWGRAI